jgi:hypothetical protein
VITDDEHYRLSREMALKSLPIFRSPLTEEVASGPIAGSRGKPACPEYFRSWISGGRFANQFRAIKGGGLSQIMFVHSSPFVCLIFISSGQCAFLLRRITIFPAVSLKPIIIPFAANARLAPVPDVRSRHIANQRSGCHCVLLNLNHLKLSACWAMKGPTQDLERSARAASRSIAEGPLAMPISALAARASWGRRRLSIVSTPFGLA